MLLLLHFDELWWPFRGQNIVTEFAYCSPLLYNKLNGLLYNKQRYTTTILLFKIIPIIQWDVNILVRDRFMESPPYFSNIITKKLNALKKDTHIIYKKNEIIFRGVDWKKSSKRLNKNFSPLDFRIRICDNNKNKAMFRKKNVFCLGIVFEICLIP